MKMTKVFALTLLASVFAISAPVAAQQKAEVTLKAVTNNPKNSGHYRGLEIYKRLVEERTKGRVAVQLYSDAVLGDEEQMAEGMQMGTVDVMMAAAAKYANFVPEMDLYSPPYAFKSWAHLKAVTSGEVDKIIAEKVKAKRGDIYLGLFTDGARNVFTKTPVKTLAELDKFKLRTMTGPNELAAWKAFGTNPTPLAYTELYSALQVGVVDGAENTMTSLLGMKFWESCKFVLRTEHSYLALPFFMSAKAVAKVPADLREIVIQAGKDTAKQQVDMAIRMDKESEEILKKNGVQVFEMSKADKDKAIALMQPIHDDNAKRIGMTKELAMIREAGKKF